MLAGSSKSRESVNGLRSLDQFYRSNLRGFCGQDLFGTEFYLTYGATSMQVGIFVDRHRGYRFTLTNNQFACSRSKLHFVRGD